MELNGEVFFLKLLLKLVPYYQHGGERREVGRGRGPSSSSPLQTAVAPMIKSCISQKPLSVSALSGGFEPCVIEI